MEAERDGLTLSDFRMLSQIGVGNYAKVILVRRKDTSRVYAMKIIKKRRQVGEVGIGEGKGKGVKKEHAYIEKEALSECKHPFIVKLYSTFQRHRKLYYVLEYCPGGELFGIIRRLKRLSQESAKFYAAQIVMAIAHLHAKGFVYRDLKPENVLIDRRGFVKIIDFGLSCRLSQVELADPIAGTPEYLPPEIFEKGTNISQGVDWWALGNIIFEMVVGFPPFFVQRQPFSTIKHKICNEEPPLYFISNPLLKDLLTRLLDKRPGQRLGVRGSEQITSHGWFYGTNWEGLLQEQVNPPFLPEVKDEADTRWFQLQPEEMSPPESMSASDKSGAEPYHEFSLSWKSSRQLQLVEHAASPPEILVDMSEGKE